MVSTDQGVTYSLVYTYPVPDFANGYLQDYCQFCFGGDGLGNYGVHVTADQGSYITGDLGPHVAFVPILGLGSFGTPTEAQLDAFDNLDQTPCITASEDGRVWSFGHLSGLGPGFSPAPSSGITSTRVTFKSPGPIDQNYAGPWDVSITNLLNESIVYPTYDSQPAFGLWDPPRSILYDDKRKALYVLTMANTPYFSQNVSIYFSLSRNNGHTWSKAINIANTEVANRGFESMALDPVRGDLVFGWYDGRNDKTFQSLEYFAGYIPACTLDQMVNEIPLSNPIYVLPSSVQSGQSGVSSHAVSQKNMAQSMHMMLRIKTRLERIHGLCQKK